MAEIRIAGVLRAGAYSPNHIGNDAAIFNATADQLRKRGCVVNIYSEEQFRSIPIEEDMILNMCREKESISLLKEYEEQGKLVVNSGYGIENCTREMMTRLLTGHHIPSPESIIVDTNEKIAGRLEKNGFQAVWIKRGDFHAMHKEDVSYCRHPQEAQEVLHEYFYRGIRRAVVSRHLNGDLIKFYGIVGQPFFYWFNSSDGTHSSPEAMVGNGRDEVASFDVKSLEELCRKAADILEVQIFGGDCIVESDGSIKIIGLNDWPSFAPCRKEAAPWIAKCAIKKYKEWMNGSL